MEEIFFRRFGKRPSIFRNIFSAPSPLFVLLYLTLLNTPTLVLTLVACAAAWLSMNPGSFLATPKHLRVQEGLSEGAGLQLCQTYLPFLHKCTSPFLYPKRPPSKGFMSFMGAPSAWKPGWKAEAVWTPLTPSSQWLTQALALNIALPPPTGEDTMVRWSIGPLDPNLSRGNMSVDRSVCPRKQDLLWLNKRDWACERGGEASCKSVGSRDNRISAWSVRGY